MTKYIDVNTQNVRAAGASGKSLDFDMLWSMSTLAERAAHAMRTRGLSQSDLDSALAQKLGKKGRSSGYMTRLLKRGQQPRASHLTALAEILNVSDAWLLRGEGPMDRGESHLVPTYDSLPGWAAAAAEELAKQRVAEYAIRAAGRAPAAVRPREISAEFVFRVTMFWLENTPEDERAAVMHKEAQRIKSEEDAGRSRH